MGTLMRNGPNREFVARVMALVDGTHVVERLQDGVSVRITKPGYKGPWDFVVEVVGLRAAPWKVSHADLMLDVQQKLHQNLTGGVWVVEQLRRVCSGDEPDELLASESPPSGLPGIPVEVILKSYKWIWAQEDINYPPPRGRGRWMSMDAITEIARKEGGLAHSWRRRASPPAHVLPSRKRTCSGGFYRGRPRDEAE